MLARIRSYILIVEREKFAEASTSKIVALAIRDVKRNLVISTKEDRWRLASSDSFDEMTAVFELLKETASTEKLLDKFDKNCLISLVRRNRKDKRIRRINVIRNEFNIWDVDSLWLCVMTRSSILRTTHTIWTTRHCWCSSLWMSWRHWQVDSFIRISWLISRASKESILTHEAQSLSLDWRNLSDECAATDFNNNHYADHLERDLIAAKSRDWSM